MAGPADDRARRRRARRLSLAPLAMELTSPKGGCGPVIKRSPLDDDPQDASDGGPGPVLVLNPDADAGELVARLVESAGFAALRFTERESLLEQLSEGG